MEEKKMLNEEDLEKVNGGEIGSSNVVGYIVVSKNGQDWIACPDCGSINPFVSINGWWCCADCGIQIKKDRRS